MNIHHPIARRLGAAIVALGMVVPFQAQAHNLGYAIQPANFPFSGAGVLTDVGLVTNVFTKPANQRLIVTFSAECAVDAPAGNTTAWLDVDLELLDAVTNAVVLTLTPSVGNMDALCSSNGTAANDGWASNSVQGLVPWNFAAGNYKVRVRARLNNGATGGWLGERMVSVSL